MKTFSRPFRPIDEIVFVCRLFSQTHLHLAMKTFPVKISRCGKLHSSRAYWYLSAALGWCWCGRSSVPLLRCVFGWVEGRIVWAEGVVLKRKEAEKVKATSHTEKIVLPCRAAWMYISVVSGQLFVGWDRPLRRSFFFSAFGCVPRQSAYIRWSIFWGNLSEFFMTVEFFDVSELSYWLRLEHNERF